MCVSSADCGGVHGPLTKCDAVGSSRLLKGHSWPQGLSQRPRLNATTPPKTLNLEQADDVYNRFLRLN